MNSIVLDLEWNQAQTRDREAPGLTFEVIEIGAVRLDEHGNQTDSFSCLIRPCVYTELFYRVREVVGISMKQLEAEGIPFWTRWNASGNGVERILCSLRGATWI